jgi:hypothetical protein
MFDCVGSWIRLHTVEFDYNAEVREVVYLGKRFLGVVCGDRQILYVRRSGSKNSNDLWANASISSYVDIASGQTRAIIRASTHM